MQYLQADTSRNILRVNLAKRDFSDFDSQLHLDYFTSTLQLFDGSHVDICIEASSVPYSALLHMPLFVRVVNHSKRMLGKVDIRSVDIREPSLPASTIIGLLTPILPSRAGAYILGNLAGNKRVKKSL